MPEPSSSPSPLPVQCLTLDLRHASAELRDRCALPPEVFHEAMRKTVREGRQAGGLDRLVVLATCQRVELYSALRADDPARTRLLTWLAGVTGVDVTALDAHAAYHEGGEVARHLCQVATGLDATLLGEAQIVSQVASAIRHAVAAHAASPILKALFRTAVITGERARGAVWSRYARTDIGSVSMNVAKSMLGTLQGKQAVVVGAGNVGELALRALRAHGVTQIALVNRTRERAVPLAARAHATVHTLDALPAVLRDADFAIVATNTHTPIVTHEMLEEVMGTRTERPLVIVDAGMPINVDPHVRSIPSVQLMDLDDLQPALAQAHDERASAIPDVEAIIEHGIAQLLQRQWEHIAQERGTHKVPRASAPSYA